MKVAVFSTKPYDKAFLEAANIMEFRVRGDSYIMAG
jgi:hypothetical protein